MIPFGSDPSPYHRPRKPRQEPIDVTVCVAAIANTGMILAASDRMLSTAEIAYEPDSRKIWTFTSAISALWSGDASIQAEVLGLVQRDINGVLAQDEPADWFNVKEVVDLYIAHRNAVKRQRAVAEFLSPLGLDLPAFLAAQATMAPGVVDRLTNALVNHELPFTSCIVAGQDHAGSHLWVVEDGVARCENASGFAVIGAGARHANSQMMIGGHSAQKTPSETLVLVHLAKKRAEVSPSVGAATDILLVGPNLGQHGFLPDEHLAQLDLDYAKLQRSENRALAKAVMEFDKYLASYSATQIAGPQESEED